LKDSVRYRDAARAKAYSQCADPARTPAQWTPGPGRVPDHGNGSAGRPVAEAAKRL